jgi:hypothetical protein
MPRLSDPDKLRNLLHECRLSRRRAARWLGVTDRAMFHWLAGQRPINQAVMRALGLLSLVHQSDADSNPLPGEREPVASAPDPAAPQQSS